MNLCEIAFVQCMCVCVCVCVRARAHASVYAPVHHRSTCVWRGVRRVRHYNNAAPKEKLSDSLPCPCRQLCLALHLLCHSLNVAGLICQRYIFTFSIQSFILFLTSHSHSQLQVVRMGTQRGRVHRRGSPRVAHEREHIYPSLGHHDRRMSPAQGTG
jgi:hypothetical protein